MEELHKPYRNLIKQQLVESFVIENHQTKVNLQAWAKGMYFIKLGKLTKKFIVE